VTSTSITLLQRLRQRSDQEAWALFVGLYTPLLQTWSLRLGVPKAEVEDFLQDLFTHLVCKLPEFRYNQGQSFRGWLWMVAHNQWLNHCRQRRPETASEAMIAGLCSPQPDVADSVAEAEYRQVLVARALDLMQADFQAHVWKAFWECAIAERPAAEVARDLGMTVGAVYAAKFRVLSRLRQQLDGMLQ
jgi:RNA polymerase sigma-70 factor, ECF subfamily